MKAEYLINLEAEPFHRLIGMSTKGKIRGGTAYVTRNTTAIELFKRVKRELQDQYGSDAVQQTIRGQFTVLFVE